MEAMDPRPLTGEPISLELLNTRWPQDGEPQDLLSSLDGLAIWLASPTVASELGEHPVRADEPTLAALLRARERAGAGPKWLIFGERNEAHDLLCSDEVRAWQANGVLEHFDGVFSRDGATRRYVQHRLVERAATLRRWIEAGAAVHVCGSRERLAVGVDAALARILGDEGFARLRESGRYRRDVW